KPKPKAAPKEKKEKKPKTEKAPEPEYSNTTPAATILVPSNRQGTNGGRRSSLSWPGWQVQTRRPVRCPRTTAQHHRILAYRPGSHRRHTGLADPMPWYRSRRHLVADPTRHDVSRETFVAGVWEWKEKYAHRIYVQFKRFDRRTIGIGWSSRWVLNPPNPPARPLSVSTTKVSSIALTTSELARRTLLPVPGYEDHEKLEIDVLVQFALPG
ncbi:hypothetical protein BC936DRAFT_143695, partial [Jimgerdemannia flammicorona]